MASINIQRLLVELNREIQNTTSPGDLFILSRAVSVLKSGAVISVPFFSNLPDAQDNLGSLYLVEADKLLYHSFKDDYSGNVSWVPITQINYSTLWSWGCNSSGQLGDGTVFNRNFPGVVSGGGSNWKVLCTGGYHSAAIKDDGTLWTWGCNANGILGDGTTVSRCSPGTVAGGGTTWCELSIGYFSSAAVKTDGTLWTWGCNANGILGDGTTVSRCSPGTVAGGGTTWSCVTFGRCHSLGLKNDGTLWSWGCNNFGQLGEGTTLSRCSPGTVSATSGSWWSTMAAGRYHSIGTIEISTFSRPSSRYQQSNNIPQKLNSVWGWGRNNYCQVGDRTSIDRCSPVLHVNNSFLCRVFAGGNSSFATSINLLGWGWGRNNYGQLGDGTTINRDCTASFFESDGTDHWCHVQTNGNTTLGIRVDGTLWTWGLNSNGILADGTTVNRCSPGQIVNGKNTWSKGSISSGGNIIANNLETL